MALIITTPSKREEALHKKRAEEKFRKESRYCRGECDYCLNDKQARCDYCHKNLCHKHVFYEFPNSFCNDDEQQCKLRYKYKKVNQK